MKKAILIAVLFCFATTPVVMAQSKTGTTKSDPAYSQSQQMRDRKIMRDEANRKGIPASKMEQSKTHISTSPRVRTVENEKIYKQQIADDEKTQVQTLKKKPATGKAVENQVVRGKALRQQTKDDATMTQDAQMSESKAKLGKKSDVIKGTTDKKKDENVRKKAAKKTKRAFLRMEKASQQLASARNAYDKLLVKHNEENAALAQKHALEAANGVTDEMTKRHSTEVNRLEATHARELMDAQKKIDEEMMKYESASAVYEAAKENE